MAKVLGVVGSAADGVQSLRTGLVEPALRGGWRVAVTLTPSAARWLAPQGEIERLQTLTGLPVRSAPRLPEQDRPHPPVSCYVVAPATANTVAKLALGIGDNQALTQVCEGIGTRGVAVVVFPRVNAAHARHPAWPAHLAALESAGVRLLYGDDVWPLREPRDEAGRDLPWAAILSAVNSGGIGE